MAIQRNTRRHTLQVVATGHSGLHPEETRSFVQHHQLIDRFPELNEFLGRNNSMLATVLDRSLMTWTAVLVASFTPLAALDQFERLMLPLVVIIPCWILAAFHQAAVLMTTAELRLVSRLTQNVDGIHEASAEDLEFALGGVLPLRRRAKFMFFALFFTIRFYVYFLALAAVTLGTHLWVGGLP
jgi:hypothetical protein